MFGWIGIIGLVIGATFSFGGFGTITGSSATLFCGALALLFIGALIVVAGRSTSQF